MEIMPKILIVEDEPIIAKDLQYLLKNNEYQIIGIAHDSEAGLDMIHNRQPDLVLLDINIEGQKDGIELGEILQKNYQIPFLYITSYADEATLSRAKNTMPAGYIVKPFDERTLLTTIAVVVHNFAVNTNAKLCKSTVDAISNNPLSEREFIILEEVLKGTASASIAKSKCISINTVKFHLKNIYLKLQVSSKAELLSKILTT